MAFGHDHAGADAADPVFDGANPYIRLETLVCHPFLPSSTGYNAIGWVSAKADTIISHHLRNPRHASLRQTAWLQNNSAFGWFAAVAAKIVREHWRGTLDLAAMRRWPRPTGGVALRD
jgi:hypothetical protein